MAENDNGIQAMRARMERASRKPPPARRPPIPAPPVEEAANPPAPAATPPDGPREEVRPRRTRRAARPALRLAPDDPPVNLAIRVRRPLDERLVEIIHTLRGGGVRTSKVELIEMLLWETADDPAGVADLRARLGRFRAHAPRAASGVIPD